VFHEGGNYPLVSHEVFVLFAVSLDNVGKYWGRFVISNKLSPVSRLRPLQGRRSVGRTFSGKNAAINSPFVFNVSSVLNSISCFKDQVVPVDRNDLVCANVVLIGFSNYERVIRQDSSLLDGSGKRAAWGKVMVNWFNSTA
jgi:hypothetical protein